MMAVVVVVRRMVIIQARQREIAAGGLSFSIAHGLPMVCVDNTCDLCDWPNSLSLRLSIAAD